MKKKITYTILLATVLSVAFLSCKKKEYVPLYYGYDYFPNKVGHFIIYECDSIVHLGSGYGDSTYKFQIKEVIDSMYNNNQGQPTQRIVRYKRTDTNTPWSTITLPEKVWTATLLSNMAIRQEDNFQYIKLVFPPSLNETWNGNGLNTMQASSYQYTTLNSPYNLTTTVTHRNIHFDSTTTVSETKDSSFLNYGYYFEQYATGVGMIHRIVYVDSSTVFPPPGYSSPDTSLLTTRGVWYTETCLTSGNQ